MVNWNHFVLFAANTNFSDLANKTTVEDVIKIVPNFEESKQQSDECSENGILSEEYASAEEEDQEPQLVQEPLQSSSQQEDQEHSDVPEQKQLESHSAARGISAANALSEDHIDSLIRHDEGYRVLKGIRTSPAHWEAEKKKVMAMIRQIGLPTFFITLSAAETRVSSLVTSSLLRRGLSSSYGRDPQNPCYCKDRCGDPCYNKDRCKVLAAARTEMRSLVRQGLLWKPCYCKDFDPCYSKKLLVFATAKLTTRSLLRKTGALILATVRIAGESLLLKTGDLILATGRIAEESLLRKTGDLILATGRIAEESLLLKTGDLILATGRIAEESLLLKTGDLILATGRIADWTLGTPRVVDRFLLLQEVLARTDSRVSS
ncbi:hypothetical protein ACLKA6_013293 [Drosophila palustris]